MWTDVLDLNEFYSSTQGQMTVRLNGTERAIGEKAAAGLFVRPD